MSLLEVFKNELQERFPSYTIQTVESTRHINILRLLKEGKPNLIAKTIWHDASEPLGNMGIESQDNAYNKEVRVLRMLPEWWSIHLVDHFKTVINRIIVTNEMNNTPWASYKNGKENDTRIAQQLLEQIHWLHSKNIAHNDLELKNILLTDSRNPVIIDFEKSILHATKPQMNDDYRKVLDNLNERVNTRSIGIILRRFLKNADIYAGGKQTRKQKASLKTSKKLKRVSYSENN
jgi:RIO-like serine/threonine protein kinase